MIVWGGFSGNRAVGDGARYDPTTDSWTSIASPSATLAGGRSVVWTGSEMIVWGGRDFSGARGDGARYFPPFSSSLGLSPLGQLWIEILQPTQVYSVTDDPLWVAQEGERYYAIEQAPGWILAAWEGDTASWAVWIALDDRVQAATINRPVVLLPVRN